MNAFLRLLGANPSEAMVQEFLERHPRVVAGSDYLLSDAVIAKLPLGNDHVTDFAFINPTSGATFLRLVEIEAPTKHIFNQDDQLTPHFQQALTQIKDWLGWCGRGGTYLSHLFAPLYRSGGYTPSSLTARGILIYGRQAEINSDKRARRWESEVQHNQTFVTIRTYDGFARDRELFLDASYQNRRGVTCVSYRNQEFQPKLARQLVQAGGPISGGPAV